MFNRRRKQCFATCFRHSRAYLHALFKSDTAAMHHITIHNITYQVSAKKYLHEGSPASVLPSLPSQYLFPLIHPLFLTRSSSLNK